MNAPIDSTTPHETAHSDLLDRTAAAAHLDVAVRTLDEWTAARALPCVKRGRWVRYLRKDLDDFIVKCRVESVRRPAFRSRAGKQHATPSC